MYIIKNIVQRYYDFIFTAMIKSSSNLWIKNFFEPSEGKFYSQTAFNFKNNKTA